MPAACHNTEKSPSFLTFCARGPGAPPSEFVRFRAPWTSQRTRTCSWRSSASPGKLRSASKKRKCAVLASQQQQQQQQQQFERQRHTRHTRIPRTLMSWSARVASLSERHCRRRYRMPRWTRCTARCARRAPRRDFRSHGRPRARHARPRRRRRRRHQRGRYRFPTDMRRLRARRRRHSRLRAGDSAGGVAGILCFHGGRIF